MLDFRYHALSLVAVFLALGIGILLGTTIGDQLVSEANRDLSTSLRGDVTEAPPRGARRPRGAGRPRALHRRVVRAHRRRPAARPQRGGRLLGRAARRRGARRARRGRGRRRRGGGVAEIVPPPSLPELGEAIPRRFDGLLADDPRTAALGRRDRARARAPAAALPGGCADRFPDRFRGEFPQAPTRSSTTATPARTATRDQERFEQGLIDGLRLGARARWSASRRSTPTRARSSFYEDRMPASVDNVNTPGGADRARARARRRARQLRLQGLRGRPAAGDRRPLTYRR